LLVPFLQAFEQIRGQRPHTRGVLYLSPSLPENVRRFAQRKASGVSALEIRGAPGVELSGFDLALVASGTASLECACATLPPLIAFRSDRLSFALARRLVHVEHIGLPNIVAGQRLFPELVQDQATASSLSAVAGDMLSRRDEYRARCTQVHQALKQPGSQTSVSEILRAWMTKIA
jgi:lipid-A-disaccharide synthase